MSAILYAAGLSSNNQLTERFFDLWQGSGGSPEDWDDLLKDLQKARKQDQLSSIMRAKANAVTSKPLRDNNELFKRAMARRKAKNARTSVH